jgi:hypothetical protein
LSRVEQILELIANSRARGDVQSCAMEDLVQ